MFYTLVSAEEKAKLNTVSFREPSGAKFTVVAIGNGSVHTLPYSTFEGAAYCADTWVLGSYWNKTLVFDSKGLVYTCEKLTQSE